MGAAASTPGGRATAELGSDEEPSGGMQASPARRDGERCTRVAFATTSPERTSSTQVKTSVLCSSRMGSPSSSSNPSAAESPARSPAEFAGSEPGSSKRAWRMTFPERGATYTTDSCFCETTTPTPPPGTATTLPTCRIAPRSLADEFCALSVPWAGPSSAMYRAPSRPGTKVGQLGADQEATAGAEEGSDQRWEPDCGS
mmetsp:Transcript_4896/g.11917  ORF Transcript_4896/g.11917 Transcript_4896/m.11917 type:complete len:200 (+) Transcript_4896:2877-3476(+)